MRLISPSLTLSVSCQSSLPITAAVHSPSVNSPSNLPASSPYCFYLLFCSFAHQYFYLHIITCTSITPVLICKIVITLLLWPIYCLTSSRHLHTLYIYFLIFFSYCVHLTVHLFIPCVTLCCCLCRTGFILARSQL